MLEIISKNKFINNVSIGIKWGAIAFPFKIAVFSLTHTIALNLFSMRSAKYLLSKQSLSVDVLVYTVFVGPLLEEIVVRLGIQKSIMKVQLLIINVSPTWLTSSKIRILTTGILFAGLHCIGATFMTAEIISRIAFLVLLPVESILFEKSGFTAALTAHISHNLLIVICRASFIGVLH